MEVYIVWHWLRYDRNEIEAIFWNEQDAIAFCNARKNHVIPGYCNYGHEPEYTWSAEKVFNLEDYEKELNW